MASNQNGSYSSFKFSHKGKKRGLIAGLVSFAVLQGIFGSVFGWIPIIGGIVKLLGLGVSAVIGLVVAVMNTDLDVATPRQQKKLERELNSLAHTGDAAADDVITKGQQMVREIREANDAIPDPDITRQLYDIENICIQIFKTVSETPAKAPQIRKFMNYYLPTTTKMLQSYRTMQERGVSGGDLREAREALGRGLGMIRTACQKQLDSLFKDNIMDVSTDIDVLEQMMKRDGFSQEGGTDNAPQLDFSGRSSNARTAAAAQMGSRSHPTLQTTDLNSVDIYPHYASKQSRDDE